MFSMFKKKHVDKLPKNPSVWTIEDDQGVDNHMITACMNELLEELAPISEVINITVRFQDSNNVTVVAYYTQ